MKNIFRVKVDFVIYGSSQDFQKTGDIVGISDAHIQRKSEVKVKEYAADSWWYSTGYKETYDTSNLLIEVKTLLENRATEISRYIRDNKLEALFSLYVKSNSDILPALIVPKEFVVFAAKFPATIDFDIYANLGEQV